MQRPDLHVLVEDEGVSVEVRHRDASVCGDEVVVEGDEGLENSGDAAHGTAEAQTMYLHASIGQLERTR